MKFLGYIFLCVFIAVVIYSLFSLVRVAYVHIKACVIRRKLSNLAMTEKKDD